LLVGANYYLLLLKMKHYFGTVSMYSELGSGLLIDPLYYWCGVSVIKV